MDFMDNMEEPQWLETAVSQGSKLRVWHIIFMSLAAVTTLIVMVCCCFRFRIPRTKQQIEANYQRRQITTKFRQQLETIQDTKIDAMSLSDALELLHDKKKTTEDNNGSQPSSGSPQQSSLEPLEAGPQPGGQKPGPQVSGLSFVKFATKVSHLSKLGARPAEPEPAPANNNLDF